MAAQKIWGEIQKRQDAAAAGADYDGPALSSHVVVVATGFSEHVLSWLARQWGSDSLKILPVVLQKTGVLNFEIQQLGDLAAVTGAKVFDVVNNPLDNFQIEDLGPGVSQFECHRWRSTVLGYARSPGTRTNSRSLLVTRIQPSLRAWAASHRSLLPIGKPACCRLARIWP